jgi:predicted Zn-ribbon and HTH transcriptional regulator
MTGESQPIRRAGTFVTLPRLNLEPPMKITPPCKQCGAEWRRKVTNKDRVCIRCKTGEPNE